MRRFLGQDRKQPQPSSNGRSIQSKALVGKPQQSSSHSCISSESIADCQSSCGELVEDRGSGKYAATHCGQGVVKGDNYSAAKKVLPHETSNSGSASSVVEEGDGEIQQTTVDADQNARCNVFIVQNKCVKLDVMRIKETLKKRKCNAVVKKRLEAIVSETNSEAWIESELENGIEVDEVSAEKKQRKLL